MMRARALAPPARKGGGNPMLFWGLMACFLLGVLLLFTLCAGGSFIPSTQGAENQLWDRQEGNWLKVYGQSYFAFFLQSSLLLAAGFSGLGVVLLPVLFLVYGGASLYGILSLYLLEGVTGLFHYWQMYWLPQLGSLVLLCLVGSRAFDTAIGLGKGLVTKPAASGKIPYKPAMLRYWVCLVAAAAVSGLSVLLGQLFL